MKSPARDKLREYEDVRYEREIKAEQDSHILRVDPWHFYSAFGPRWVDTSVRSVIFGFGDVRRKLGLRAWVVNGGFRVTNGEVESIWADVRVEGENEWLMADWTYAPEISLYETKLYKEHGMYRPEMNRYFVHWTHLHMGEETGEGIRNSITPAGNTDEQNAARNINLQCLTSVRGCHSLCDLMPDANRFRREHTYVGWGWNSGSWAPQDHACQ